MNEDSETYLNDDVDDDCFINTDDENLHDSGSTAAAENNTGDSQLNSIYLELAEKEEALLLAAQFGKTLIDEKEELERQLDTLKRDQHSQLETYEQETYQLKRLIESMKNEYESKIYELNDDVCILSKKIKQYERNVNLSSSSYEIHNEELELIQELKDRNLALVSQLNSSESQLSSVNENNLALENKIDAKEKVIDENAKLLSSYQKEVCFLFESDNISAFAFL
jgi:chromosome segregation ATPase